MVDLLVLWAWEYDADFIALMQKSAAAAGIQLLCLGPDDVFTAEARLASGEIQARALLDRVWDWGGEYEQHVPVAKTRIRHVINDFDLVRQVWHSRPFTTA